LADEKAKIFVCFESHYEGCAERLDAWPHTNHDKSFYNSRTEVPVESEAAEPIKQILREQIHEADVTVCFISQTTCLDDWIAWELETSKTGPNRHGLVGIMLHEHGTHPSAMVDSGAMFVPFRRDVVELAIELAMTEDDASGDFSIQDD
jgi:hypothetical protein